ncbi:hypothetical protein FSP39_025062 [Pinctada imbricata]|uniref:PAT complex subunit CCDC47 n=1 Tax=Pinctada imbricata TaxID=66713 RepID=A0AA88YPD9_PINIB|nr:hypothetical protein FSP39_025062 [Pinctada imbricata]
MHLGLHIGLLLAVTVFMSTVYSANQHDADIDDNEFAEFEDFDDEEVDQIIKKDTKSESDTQEKVKVTKDSEFIEDEEEEESTVETEDDDEFEQFDEEEFEKPEADKPLPMSKSKEEFKIKPADVPQYLQTRWDSFYMEILMLAGLGVYFLNFLQGKNKNHRLAQTWLSAHKDILDANFSIVGDDGTSKEVQGGTLMKESENVYALWCSGRSCVEGMLVELKFLKRQDLISTIAGMFKPASDQIQIQVDLDQKVMDKFVFAIAQKRSATKLHKDMVDLSQFTEKKNVDRKVDIPSCFQVMSEIGEATNAILDKKVCQVLQKYESCVEYMHFSDQFAGIKSQEEGTPSKLPLGKPVLSFCFNVPGKGKSKPSDMEEMKPLLQLVIYCVDKISRMQLSKEARNKAEKNRQKAEEEYERMTHAQRQEAAQARREEKRRAEKERLLNEEDPDKARKLEERESKKEMRKKQPKMKMMKVKAM